MRNIELRVGQVCAMIGTKLTGREINELLNKEKETYHRTYSLSDVRKLRLKLKKPAVAQSTLVVAVHSRSTGAGKTVIAANLGASFAWQGMRTLIIDGDASGDLSVAVSCEIYNRRNINIIDVMDGAPLNRAIQSIYTDGMLDIIPVSKSLTIAEAHLSLGQASLYKFKEWRMKNAKVLCANYDIIVVDTNSYPTRLTYNLLLGADLILNIIPITSFALEESASITGFYSASEQYENVKFPPSIYLANGVQPALTETEFLLRGLAEQHAGELCNVVIPLHTSRKVAPKFAGIIAEKEPASYAAQCFFAMAEDINKRLNIG